MIDNNGILHTKTAKGVMRVVVSSFFPCSAGDMNKLFKAIKSSWQNDSEEIAREIVLTLKERIEAKTKSMRNCAKLYLDYHQTEVELKEQLGRGKLPNGIKLTKDVKESITDQYKSAKRTAKSCMGSFKSYKSEIKRLQSNVDRLEKMIDEKAI